MSELQFTPSIWDRLIGSDRDVPQGRCSRSFFVASVARDLEHVLNSKSAPEEAGLGRLGSFGIKDVIGLNLTAQKDCDALIASITQAIARHEPRLKDVSVRLLGFGDAGKRVNFAIQAVLVMPDSLEPVSFNTTLTTVRQQYHIER
ncbi:type VI secretion system baseplate subunit TssE [Aquabacterium sp.]|uniref:type VI secretion system baseplate subunit TssE n=1 Tax=Aquabacterium sp. TaxID=1872578 RepID=UPI0025B8FB2A|nr:type VI secretion system baseplate subunit TssE [Aquabacterium sp.]